MHCQWIVESVKDSQMEWRLIGNWWSESSSVETLRQVPIVHLFPVTLRDGQGLAMDWRDIRQCVPMNCQLVTMQFWLICGGVVWCLAGRRRLKDWRDGLTWPLPIRADALPIGDRPLLMIRIVLVPLTEWGIKLRLASWQWIGWIGVADCYVRNHPPLRLIVDPNRRLVPRLRAALVLR